MHDYTSRRTISRRFERKVRRGDRADDSRTGQERIRVTSVGLGIVRRMALNQLISSEVEAAAGKEHHDSAISPENYS
jgi:hypothetical protein